MFSYSDQIQRSSFPTSLPNGDFLGGEGDSGTGRPQGGRAKRGGSSTKNIVPVEIAQLNNYREDNGPLMIHGIEVSLVKLVSQLRGVDQSNMPESLSFTLDDNSGRIEGIQYLTGDEDVAIPVQNSWVSIIGALKIGRERNMLKVYQMRLVQSTAEVDAHQLEMALLPVRMGRMQTQAAARAKATFDSLNTFKAPGGFSRNSLATTQQPAPQRFQSYPGHHFQHQSYKSFPGHNSQHQSYQSYPGQHSQYQSYQKNSGPVPAQQSYQDQRFRQSAPAPAPLHRHIQSSYSSPETDRIYSTIKDCLAGDGISRQELYIIFRGQMSSSKVDEGLETLGNEGHIYTTLNENYFKSIES